MIVRFTKTFLFAVAVGAMLTLSASAGVIVVDEDFDSGLTDGDLAGQPGWAGQAGSVVNQAFSTATTTNAWLGVSNTNGAAVGAPGSKYTVTQHFRFQNLASDVPGNATLATFGLGTSDTAGNVRRLGNGDSESIAAGLTKQAGQITVRPNGAFGDGQGDFVVTNADVGFDFGADGLTPDSSDLLEIVYMATRSATANEWDVMVSLTNLDTATLLGSGSAVTTSAAAYDPPVGIGGSATNELYAGWAVLGAGQNNFGAYPPGARGAPLSGLQIDRLIFETNVPEPTSLAVASIACLVAIGLRRHS